MRSPPFFTLLSNLSRLCWLRATTVSKVSSTGELMVLKLRPMVEIDAVLRGLKKTLPERHHHLLPLNEQALRKGMELV